MTGEPQELWKAYITDKSPEIKDQLVHHYIPLVERVAAKASCSLPEHLSKDDLVGYGVFGLLEAVDRYNPEQGVPFQYFAVKRIKGAMIDGIRKEDWVPVTVRKKAKLLEQAYQKIEKSHGSTAGDEEVAAELNITVNELMQWLKDIQYITILSLDEPLDADGVLMLKDSVTDAVSPDPVKTMEKNEIKKYLAKAVGELPEKERTVISLFYYNDLSNKEIARVLELSDSRISQLHTKAIFRLRGKLSRLKKGRESWE